MRRSGPRHNRIRTWSESSTGQCAGVRNRARTVLLPAAGILASTTRKRRPTRNSGDGRPREALAKRPRRLQVTRCGSWSFTARPVVTAAGGAVPGWPASPCAGHPVVPQSARVPPALPARPPEQAGLSPPPRDHRVMTRSLPAPPARGECEAPRIPLRSATQLHRVGSRSPPRERDGLRAADRSSTPRITRRPVRRENRPVP